MAYDREDHCNLDDAVEMGGAPARPEDGGDGLEEEDPSASTAAPKGNKNNKKKTPQKESQDNFCEKSNAELRTMKVFELLSMKILYLLEFIFYF